MTRFKSSSSPLTPRRSVVGSAGSIGLAGAAALLLNADAASNVLHVGIVVLCGVLALWSWPATTWQLRPVCWIGFGASISVLATIAVEQAPAGERWGQLVILGGAYLGFVSLVSPLVLTVDRHARVWPGDRLHSFSASFAVQCGIAVAAGAVGLATVYVTAVLTHSYQMGDLLAAFWTALWLGAIAALVGLVRADRATSTPPAQGGRFDPLLN
jgi:hypothetical protein